MEVNELLRVRRRFSVCRHARSVCCFQVVSLLLCQGADSNARDNWNYTPLHEAAIKGKIDVCIGETKNTVCVEVNGINNQYFSQFFCKNEKCHNKKNKQTIECN